MLRGRKQNLLQHLGDPCSSPAPGARLTSGILPAQNAAPLLGTSRPAGTRETASAFTGRGQAQYICFIHTAEYYAATGRMKHLCEYKQGVLTKTIVTWNREVPGSVTAQPRWHQESGLQAATHREGTGSRPTWEGLVPWGDECVEDWGRVATSLSSFLHILNFVQIFVVPV